MSKQKDYDNHFGDYEEEDSSPLPQRQGRRGGEGTTIPIVPLNPVVFENAVRSFAEKWEKASTTNENAEYFTIGDIREALAATTPFATDIDPIEKIREILTDCGLTEEYTEHSGVCYVLTRVNEEQFVNSDGKVIPAKKELSIF